MSRFSKCDPPSHKGQSNTWFTPSSVIDQLGPFDLDPCTQSYRPFDTARLHYCEDEGVDGLHEEWFGRVWCNPPYGRKLHKWLDRMAEHRNGFALVFARTETKWFQDAAQSADGIAFLSGRIQFIRADGSKGNNAGTGSVLFLYGGAVGEVLVHSNLSGVWFFRHWKHRQFFPNVQEYTGQFV